MSKDFLEYAEEMSFLSSANRRVLQEHPLQPGGAAAGAADQKNGSFEKSLQWIRGAGQLFCHPNTCFGIGTSARKEFRQVSRLQRALQSARAVVSIIFDPLDQ
jgi:hypothetical protein